MTVKNLLPLLATAIFICQPLAADAQQTAQAPSAKQTAPHIVDAQGRTVPVKSIKKKGWWDRLWSDDSEVEVELKNEGDEQNIAEVKDPEQQKVTNEIKAQSRVQGAALGSAQGAALGTAGGPVGAAAGSVAGGVAGAVTGEAIGSAVAGDSD